MADLLQESLAPNTRSAYLADLAHFEGWGGRVPATDETVAAYLAAHSDVLNVATLQRRLAALGKVHRSHGFANPVSSELVRSVLRGLKRVRSIAQRRTKALLKEDLLLTLDGTGDGLRDLRDRAVLLIGFAGGFRRSELVGLRCHDLERVRQGIIITLRRSKTDQVGEGRKIGIPLAKGRWCPVTALEEWLVKSGIAEGALFRSVGRHGRISVKPLSGEAVSLIVKERVHGSASTRPAIPDTACAQGSRLVRRELGYLAGKSVNKPVTPPT